MSALWDLLGPARDLLSFYASFALLTFAAQARGSFRTPLRLDMPVHTRGSPDIDPDGLLRLPRRAFPRPRFLLDKCVREETPSLARLIQTSDKPLSKTRSGCIWK